MQILTRRRLLASLGTASAWMPRSVPAAGRPNVLFLFSDDQRADTIRAHGNPHIRTPNLDRLARAGVSFRNNYIFGGNSGAVCVPSRAMLMSARRGFT
jgi:arylsulfatase A-like enzyme